MNERDDLDQLVEEFAREDPSFRQMYEAACARLAVDPTRSDDEEENEPYSAEEQAELADELLTTEEVIEILGVTATGPHHLVELFDLRLIHPTSDEFFFYMSDVMAAKERDLLAQTL